MLPVILVESYTRCEKAYSHCLLNSESAADPKPLPIFAINIMPPQEGSMGNAVGTFLYTVLMPCRLVRIRESNPEDGPAAGRTAKSMRSSVSGEPDKRMRVSPRARHAPLALAGNSVNELSQNPQLWQANSKVSALNQKLFHGATPYFPQTPSRCHLPVSKLPFAPACCSEGPVEKKQETTRMTRSGIKTIFLEAMGFLWERDGSLYIVAGRGERVQG